jgi:hypothetical protein
MMTAILNMTVFLKKGVWLIWSRPFRRRFSLIPFACPVRPCPAADNEIKIIEHSIISHFDF